ncbi:hypothetical protein [Marinobacter sp. C2H3]|uniref:hypothetical protein n=1 Tax=Marinobacter sp. C2H3 TaxID=3119003 RepID=UPI00300E9892
MSRILRWSLSLTVVLELLAIASGFRALSVVAGALLTAALVVGAGQLQGYARGLFLVSLATLLLVGASGHLPPELWLKAGADAAFYAAFLGSLGLMQCLVRRFDVLRRIHDVLLGGAPFWLYPKYALVSCGIASVLSFGMMSLLCGTLSETLRERGIDGEVRIQWLRSVLISALRGFALVPLVAPTSVAVAILTRELPQLSWSLLLPFGLVSAALLVGLGWRLEYHRFRQVSETRSRLDGWPRDTGRLALVVAAVFALMALLVTVWGLKVSVAAMFAVPLVTLATMLVMDRAPAGRTPRTRAVSVMAEAADQVSGMANEMSIFASSAILGVAVTALVPTDLLRDLADLPHAELLLAVAGLLMMPMLSMVGIIPITVLSVQAGLLPAMIGAGVDPLVISVGLVIGFSLAMMMSPFGPSVMLLSRFGRVTRWQVAFRWNGAFVMVALPLLIAWMATLAVWHGGG